jgi:hypothetical protein
MADVEVGFILTSIKQGGKRDRRTVRLEVKVDFL